MSKSTIAAAGCYHGCFRDRVGSGRGLRIGIRREADMRVRPFRLLAVSAVLSLALVGCGAPGDGATGTPTPGTEASVDVAPSFEIDDLDGNVLRLSDSAGNLRLVDFWATWCPPCVEEMPMFKELQETYGPRGLVIVGLSADESIEDVRTFVAEHEIPWANAVAPEELRAEWKVTGLPQTFLVGPDGTIVKRFNAGPIPRRILIAEIEKHLPGAADTGA